MKDPRTVDKRDVFISHASEDKDAIARPLAEALKQRGYAVWYDEFEIMLGDSLLEVIERGLATCRFGVVILSPAFLRKPWAKKELEGLFAREINERRKVILPLWHNIDLNEIVGSFPMIAGKMAVATSMGTDAVAEEIIRVLGPPGTASVGQPLHVPGSEPRWRGFDRHRRAIVLVTLAILLLAVGAWFVISHRQDSAEALEAVSAPHSFPDSATFAIRVLAEGTERPVAGASVFVHKAGQGLCGPYQSDGDGMVYCTISPGDYELAIHYQGLPFNRRLSLTSTNTVVTTRIAKP